MPKQKNEVSYDNMTRKDLIKVIRRLESGIETKEKQASHYLKAIERLTDSLDDPVGRAVGRFIPRPIKTFFENRVS